MNKILFSLLFLLLGVSVLQAQDSSYARYTINNLTSSRMHGRGASYRGDSIAACFLRNELRHAGVKSLGENYFQRYTYNTHSMEGKCRITLDGKALEPFVDFRIAPLSKEVHMSLGDMPLVYVPVQTLVDTDALKTFLLQHQKELHDAIIYLDLTAFKAKDDAQQQKFNSAVANLSRRNPYGSKVLLLGRKELHTQGFSHADQYHDYALVDVLASKIPKKVKDINIDIPCQFREHFPSQNVCGIVQGISDSIVIFGAHYDHLGQMGDDIMFPGAHDNASGVAAVLEMARLAVQDTPQYTQVFLFFSGEEAGIKGSQYFVEHPLIDLTKVRLMVNIDMFCGGDDGLLIFNAEDSKTQPFVERLQTLNNVLQVIPELRLRKNSPNSDHFYFSQHCPALFFLTMGGQQGGYHDPSDTSNACGLQNFENYLTLISALAL